MCDEERYVPIKSIEEWYKLIFDNKLEDVMPTESESDSATSLARESIKRLKVVAQ